MKYVLKYKTKSKYLGFVRESYKEFDELFNIFNFLTNNKLLSWRVYKIYDISYTDMLKEKENECSSN